MPQINPTNLKTLRQKRGWSLAALATESKIERSTINRIETGKQTDNRNNTVQRLARALAVEPATLTGPNIDQPQKEVEAAKSQMNFRVSNDVRNALSLVAMRYGVKPAHVVEAAPLLFLWAAEESLKRRQQNLDALDAASAAVDEISGFAHLNGNLTCNWRGQEIADEERTSISKRDIFGLLIDNEARPHLMDDEDEDRRNPMSRLMADLVKPLGHLAEFNLWSPTSGPQFALGRDEASLLVDGDPEAINAIVSGTAALHEMPKETREGGPEQIALWAKDRAEKHRERIRELIRNLRI